MKTGKSYSMRQMCHMRVFDVAGGYEQFGRLMIRKHFCRFHSEPSFATRKADDNLIAFMWRIFHSRVHKLGRIRPRTPNVLWSSGKSLAKVCRDWPARCSLVETWYAFFADAETVVDETSKVTVHLERYEFLSMGIALSSRRLWWKIERS